MRHTSLAPVALVFTLFITLFITTLTACPKPAPVGEGEGEGEGEGGSIDAPVCHPACTTAGTACAVDNCGVPQCLTVVATAAEACSADSPFCAEGGSHPCAPGLECTSTGGAAPTCISTGEGGAACDPAFGKSRDGCADGFACLSEQKVCGPACSADGACAGTDECVGGVCFAQAAEGDPCPVEATIDINTDNDGCAPGVRCGLDATGAGPLCIADECTSDGDCPGAVCYLPGCVLEGTRCVAPVPEGGPCFAGCAGGGCDNFTQPCEAGLECRHDGGLCASGSGSIGTCVVPSGQGGSCSPSADQATDGCQAGLGCDSVAHACL